MLRLSLEPAFVLHRRPYRNTSLLLEVITPAHGRLGLVARGARGPRSRLRGRLEPFVPLLLSALGRGELLTLSGVEEAPPLPQLPPERLLSGFYVNELLLKLLPRHDPQPVLFAAYREVLAALGGQAGEEATLRIFEKRLLAELGYGLQLEYEADSGRPIEADRHYRYLLERGPVAGGRTGLSVSGRGLLALGREQLDGAVLKEIKGLTRAAIARQLEGRPLGTRELAVARRRRDDLHSSEDRER
ncbi:MAG: DNA repair protein RecO [Candidatus Competibacteraceae bacterium]|nr:DNA repair protein RecO [Candidatus Competibacteraceae bacterium]